MLALPKSVLIEDEAPRDGVRNEKRVFSVEQKLSPIADIAAAGAFGSAPSSTPPARRKWPGRTPCSQPRRRAGRDRALKAGAKHLSISVSASRTHSRKNAGKSTDEAPADMPPTIERALREGVAAPAGIQSALGCGSDPRRSSDDARRDRLPGREIRQRQMPRGLLAVRRRDAPAFCWSAASPTSANARASAPLSFVSGRADGVLAVFGVQGHLLCMRRMAHLADSK